MVRKDAKAQLLDEIIRSVSRKQDVVLPLPAEAETAYKMLDPEESDTREQASPVVSESTQSAPHKRTRTAVIPKMKRVPFSFHNFLLGFSQGIGIFLGILVVGGLIFLVFTDLLGPATVKSVLTPLINWLRAALA